MIYTTYYAAARKLPKDIVPVAISTKVPEEWKGPVYRPLAPSGSIFWQYKRQGQDEELYTQRFRREVLGVLDPHQVVRELMELSGGKDVALCCYERTGSFCHRTIVADWLGEAGYDVSEWKKKGSKGKNDVRGYRYYINADGEKVMRVSDVIKMIGKESLMVWANMLGLKGIDYKEELDRTANIGSLCHSVVENYFNPKRMAFVDYEEFGIDDPDDVQEVNNALDNFFDWFEEFSKHRRYHVKFTEQVVVGKELGGTIDCGIDGWEDPDKVIFVDYKTAKDFFLTQFLQLAAYAMLYEEVHGPDTVEGVMVILMSKKKNKKTRARFISRKDLDPFIVCFQCLFDVTRGVNILTASLPELSQIFEY